MIISPKYIFFFGADSPYSNWYRCKFIVDDVEYSSNEQYMMHQKALFFKDVETAAKIMKSNEPWVAKMLGRAVKPFDRVVWALHAFDIVVKGAYAKFSQNPELKNIILKSANKIFVEASQFDRLWGIGLGINDPNLLNECKWKGKNLLGKALGVTRCMIEQDMKLET